MDDFAALTDLSGQTAVVTGAASGIGRAVARRFASAGANLVLVDLNAAGCEQTAREVEGAENRAACVIGDARDWSLGDIVASKAVTDFGGLDVLVNCAGLFPSSPLLGLDEAHWDRVIGVNLKGAMSLCRGCALRMRDLGKGGAIVNVGSIQGVRPGPGKAAYASSKAGLAALTKVLAQELAAFSVRVNAVAPGPIRTEGAQAAAAASPAMDSKAAAYIARLPLRRFGEPDEIAVVVQFLATRASSYMTGSILVADGGSLLTGG